MRPAKNDYANLIEVNVIEWLNFVSYVSYRNICALMSFFLCWLVGCLLAQLIQLAHYKAHSVPLLTLLAVGYTDIGMGDVLGVWTCVCVYVCVNVFVGKHNLRPRRVIERPERKREPIRIELPFLMGFCGVG